MSTHIIYIYIYIYFFFFFFLKTKKEIYLIPLLSEAMRPWRVQLLENTCSLTRDYAVLFFFLLFFFCSFV